MCVFKDRLEKHITEIAELEEYEKLEEKEKPVSVRLKNNYFLNQKNTMTPREFLFINFF